MGIEAMKYSSVKAFNKRNMEKSTHSRLLIQLFVLYSKALVQSALSNSSISTTGDCFQTSYDPHVTTTLLPSPEALRAEGMNDVEKNF